MYKIHYPLVANECSNPQKSNGHQQPRISTFETFRIEELMRSKVQCSEDGFIHLQKFQTLLLQNYCFLSNYLGPEAKLNEISSIASFSETRIASSKINEAKISLIFCYAFDLLKCLVSVGKTCSPKPPKILNLVSFQVSDLLRSKLQCDQSSFTTLLQTMYLLDRSPEMKNLFKILRIKNKLNEPANNCIINYLFMGSVPCQLQLSIQKPKEKEKYFYMMSHFIYQLTRVFPEFLERRSQQKDKVFDVIKKRGLSEPERGP